MNCKDKRKLKKEEDSLWNKDLNSILLDRKEQLQQLQPVSYLSNT